MRACGRQTASDSSGKPAARLGRGLEADSARAAKINYRYNIRGWLTRINNSDLSKDISTDPGDYFGMNLLYEQNEAGLGNASQYNGNISGVKWSTNLGLASIKERGYNYGYDAMNRITGAAHKEKSVTWALPSGSSFSESGYDYDLNGNIKGFTRKGAAGSNMDILGYTYSGNQLLKVDDTGDKTKGFIDGANGENDYTYDVNGNMVSDQNKKLTAANAIQYNHLNLPTLITKGNEQLSYIYDATGRKLKQVYDSAGIASKHKVTDYAGEFVYEAKGLQSDALQFIQHDEGRIVMTGASPEYQYHLKDHLGNVRTTFTIKHSADEALATLEEINKTAEQSKFLRYDNAKRIYTSLFDHTNGSAPGYSERLNGTTNEQNGLTRSLSVMPGDTIKAEVYAKYLDINSANWTAALNTLMTQIANKTVGVVIDGSAYNQSGGTPLPLSPINHSGATGTAPMAYLNYIFINRNFDLSSLRTTAVRMTEVAKESGGDVLHEKLQLMEVVKEPGYVQIYISNDNLALGGSQIEVYFDDFKVTQVKSLVVQMDDYYPFGLTFNSFQRENGTAQNFKYNGIENEDELGLNINNSFFRMHDPALGRWWQIDPKPNFDISPYAAMSNNPILYSDPMGDTTRIYSQQGSHIYTIPDEMENQSHFVSNKYAERMEQGEEESDNEYAARVRDASIAFIGKNTVADMKSISKEANKEDMEIGFVGKISDNKEIRLKKLPIDANTKHNEISLGLQLDNKYGEKGQGGFFLVGHVHHDGLAKGVPLTTSERLWNLGTPSNDDYKPLLRSNDGGKRQSPGLIVTSVGFSVYGTGSSRTYDGTRPADAIGPSRTSYSFYKQSKKGR